MFELMESQFISSRIPPPNSSFIQSPSLISTNLNFLSFDPLLFPDHHPPQTLFPSNHFVPTRDQDDANSWSDDEVIQLFRIKSTSDNWFTDFTWDQVSRKLAEVGYKRSAEKCKEKFEAETCRSFSSSIIGYNKNLISEEEVDEHVYINNAGENSTDVTMELAAVNVNHQKAEEENSEGPTEEYKDEMRKSKKRKRKRKHKRLKMVKGLCVELVNKMMAQQEEMHKKLLEDMANRDMKREEAWRKGEMERLKREIDIREQEQDIARDRQSTIAEFLNKITSLEFFQANIDQTTKQASYQPKDDQVVKRWPREEVLALINIRSSNGDDHQESYNINNKGGGSLWERISQGMLELGYKRSAKRCKEKWENINKYFRKTKDANKKRSLDSRTCPYYHELSKLYNHQKQNRSEAATITSTGK